MYIEGDYKVNGSKPGFLIWLGVSGWMMVFAMGRSAL